MAMTSETLRQRNTAQVLKTVLADKGISRATVSASTGLARATVSRLVEDLLRADVLAEQKPEVSGGGRPSLPLTAQSLTYFTVALEVSSDRISMMVMDLTGAVVTYATEAGNFRDSSPSDVFATLERMSQQWSPPQGSVVLESRLIVPGIVDQALGRIETVPTLGWQNVYPAEYLALPGWFAQLTLCNDADAAALAFLYDAPGVLSDVTTFLYVSSDAGVGASIVLNEELFTGEHHWAGEIGHTCVDPNGPKCGCGANGCLEQYAGRDAMLRNAGLLADSSIDELLDAFRAGSVRARTAIDTAATNLGRAIANMVNLLDIDTVVLGGNLAVCAPYLREILEAELKYRVLFSNWIDTRILVDEQPDRASLTGACYQGFEKFLACPTDWMETG